MAEPKHTEVTRSHREAAALVLSTGPKLEDHVSRWIAGEDTAHRVFSDVAQAIVDAERRGYERGLTDGSEPFEALMRFYDEGQSVELYVGEGGFRHVETPSAYAYADDVRVAALSVCETLGIKLEVTK